ncbi:MAG: lysophospholipid acyltransferase family protein [Pseudomonadota bacterium]
MAGTVKAQQTRIMTHTIFNTPVLTPLLRLLAIGLLKLIRWRSIGEPPECRKFVLIGAPHTSNWDFPIMLLVVLKLRLRLYWMGKKSLFPVPFGTLMRWLGGIPIDRSRSHNTVDQIVELYRRQDELVILVPPEGTRRRVEQWKTGFYHIANNAGVPIMMGYLDAAPREAGLADFFEPTGHLDRDMRDIRAFYADKTGIRPENA